VADAAQIPAVPGGFGLNSYRTSKKLSYKEQRELEALPIEIESLETEEQALNARIA
jgi:hypothetical protein